MKTNLLLAFACLVTLGFGVWRRQPLVQARQKLNSLTEKSPVAPPLIPSSDAPPVEAATGRSKAYDAVWQRMLSMADGPKSARWRNGPPQSLSEEERRAMLAAILANPAWDDSYKLDMGEMLVASAGGLDAIKGVLDFTLQMLEKNPSLKDEIFQVGPVGLRELFANDGGKSLLVAGSTIQRWVDACGDRLQALAPEKHAELTLLLAKARPKGFFAEVAKTTDEASLNSLMQERIAPIADIANFGEFVAEAQLLQNASLIQRANTALALQMGKNFPLEQIQAFLATAGLPEATAQDYRLAAAGADFTQNGPQRIAWAVDAANSPEAKVQAMASLTEAWAKQNPNAAGNWLDKQPKGTSRDAATAAFARQILANEPPSAVDWAMTIQDQAVRAATLEALSQNSAAKAYLEGKQH